MIDRFVKSKLAVWRLAGLQGSARKNPSARLGLPVWQRLERGKPNQPFPAPLNQLTATTR
jgi:hypothetical protein